MKKNRKLFLTIIIVLALSWVGTNLFEPRSLTTAPTTTENFNTASQISKARRTHILYGDKTGGGHLYGVGKPCKSEFPKDWDADKIINEVELIAANDNIEWRKERNGYHKGEAFRDRIKIRVIKGRENKQVITAYPLNVRRNPCGE